MKALKFGTVFTTAALVIGTATAALGIPLTVNNIPASIQGRSGGSQATGSCGNIAQAPNVEINLTSSTYLKLNAQAAGDPTLYIKGPLNFCVLNSASGLSTSGQWPAGLYQVYVGDRQGGTQPFTLSIDGSSN
jgi:hypothetical protein